MQLQVGYIPDFLRVTDISIVLQISQSFLYPITSGVARARPCKGSYPHGPANSDGDGTERDPETILLISPNR